MRVKFFTLGCKTNSYESDAMAAAFLEKGHMVVSRKEEADLCVVNTCAVTATGAQKSRQLLRRVKRENPNACLAVCGCLAQTEADMIRKDIGPHILLGNKHRHRMVEFAEQALNGVFTDAVEDILKEHSFEELGVGTAQNRVRAHLKIEDGCNNFCAYCIIPYARGPVRSRSLDAILQEAKALGAHGFGEVVLTGIHIGSYGKDAPDGPGLMDVIEAVHETEGIGRIRLGSLEPVTVTEDFVRRAKQLSKLCPQFHMSLQSGCDATLKRMRRRYTTEEYKRAVSLLRENLPDTAITTDLMVGFAGETEEEFEASYDFCKSIGFSQMHIFPYSVRKGTAAEAFPHQVEEKVKTQRAAKMLALAADMKEAFYRQYLGRELCVLAEQKKGEFVHGTCANYMDVLIKTKEPLYGKTVRVKALDWQNEALLGEIIK